MRVIGKPCFHILCSFATLRTWTAILTIFLCFCLLCCVRILLGYCFTDCGKLNDASRKLAENCFCSSFSQILKFYCFRQSAKTCDVVKSVVIVNSLSVFCFVLICSNLERRHWICVFLVCLPVCTFLMRCCFMNFGSSYGSLLMSFYFFLTHILKFGLICIYLCVANTETDVWLVGLCTYLWLTWRQHTSKGDTFYYVEPPSKPKQRG